MRSVLHLAGVVAAFAAVSGFGLQPGAAASKLHFRALLSNEAGQTVGTFYERCDPSGAASSSVVLGKAMKLKAGAILAIYKAAEFNPVISTVVGAKGATIRRFGGENTGGCAQKDTEIALTMSPGGDLGTLLEVVGKGVIGDKRANASAATPYQWPWPWAKPAQ
jgi:hypothetical protein